MKIHVIKIYNPRQLPQLYTKSKVPVIVTLYLIPIKKLKLKTKAKELCI